MRCIASASTFSRPAGIRFLLAGSILFLILRVRELKPAPHWQETMAGAALHPERSYWREATQELPLPSFNGFFQDWLPVGLAAVPLWTALHFSPVSGDAGPTASEVVWHGDRLCWRHTLEPQQWRLG